MALGFLTASEPLRLFSNKTRILLTVSVGCTFSCLASFSVPFLCAFYVVLK